MAIGKDALRKLFGEAGDNESELAGIAEQSGLEVYRFEQQFMNILGVQPNISCLYNQQILKDYLAGANNWDIVILSTAHMLLCADDDCWKLRRKADLMGR